MDYTIEEFCAKRKIQDPEFLEALANCTSLQNAWDTLSPEWLVVLATQKKVLTEKELRAFAFWCAKKMEGKITHRKVRRALETVERAIHGKASLWELKQAERAAEDASHILSESAWRLEGTAKTELYDKADAADAVAYAASTSADWAAGACARFVGLDDSQAQWLRENTKPNFRKPE